MRQGEALMPWKLNAPCSWSPSCPNPVVRHGRCAEHQAAEERIRRPNGTPYATAGHRTFRAAVLARDPICVLCRNAAATVADHYPTERVDLIKQGRNPDDPACGRGLCKPCHDRKTGQTRGFGRTKQVR